jgi:glucose/arabinose dehydrogenase
MRLARTTSCLTKPNTAARTACAAVLGASLAAGPVLADDRRVHDSEAAQFVVVEVASGLGRPWALAFLPDGDLLVTERDGRLRRVRDGVLEPAPLAGTPAVAASGQGGLLDVVLHPDFESNRWLYLSYSGRQGRRSNTSVMRARYGPDGLSEQEVIFEANPSLRSSKHFGSRLAFGPNGLLYVTVGERGERWRAQTADDHYGSVLRLEDDGSAPPDNPFAAGQGLPEIFSVGHRNPQGLAVQPETGQIYAHEHGPRGGDELNLIEAGVNYGWPQASLGREYSGRRIPDGLDEPGIRQPLWHWTPSIAPSGMAFYDGEAFPAWRGNLFVGALKYELLVRLELVDGRVVHEERLLRRQLGRIRDVRLGPDGLIYLLTDERKGAIYRLEPPAAANL